MTYAIGEIIFGVDLTYMPKELKGHVDDEFLETYTETAYSGNGDSPNWFGVQMSNIDECSNEDGDTLIRKFTATDEHKAQYAEKLKRLIDDEEVEEEVKEYFTNATPRVWLLWGSS